jgi:NitT/TauT family transport system ATP-binding protein
MPPAVSIPEALETANARLAVRVQDLGHVFAAPHGGLRALEDVTFAVQRREFVSIIGPSGCGKSTLLRLVGGLLRPTSGKVDLNGQSPIEAQRRKSVGFVFQDVSLLPWRTVMQNIALPLEVNRDADRRRSHSIEELLDLVGLTEFRHFYPKQLSGGMQQRVAIARALVFYPSILLMDEPFGALDEMTRAQMRSELLRIWEVTRKTVLFVTHAIAEAILLSDRVIVLSPRPGHIREIIPIDLPRPRHDDLEITPQFQTYVARVKALLR